MALTQVKLIGPGLTAAGLVAAGLGMGAWALGSPGTGHQGPTPAPTQKPAEKAAAKPHNSDFLPETALPEVAATSPTPGVEVPPADLERKLDILLQRLTPPPIAPEALPPTRPQSLPPLEGNPPIRQAFPFVTHGGEQLEDLPQARPQPTPSSDFDHETVLAPQPRANVQPPPAPAGVDNRFDQDQPQVAQRPFLPTPSVAIPPPPATRMPGESRTFAPSLEVPENSFEVANFSPSARTRWNPFEAPAPQRSSLKEIEAQIQIARQHFERYKALYATAAIGQRAVRGSSRSDPPPDRSPRRDGRRSCW
jgi:hypothetical protein